jgi:hypothetical protein
MCEVKYIYMHMYTEQGGPTYDISVTMPPTYLGLRVLRFSKVVGLTTSFVWDMTLRHRVSCIRYFEGKKCFQLEGFRCPRRNDTKHSY